MRKHYQTILKTHFRTRLLRSRDRCGTTQEQTAPILQTSLRSYCALESGQSCCGALTLALFLIYICDDPAAFLAELKREFEEVGE